MSTPSPANDKKPNELNSGQNIESSTWDAFWNQRDQNIFGKFIRWFRKRFVSTTLLNYIKRNTPKGQLIEAGCGTGEVTLTIAAERGDSAVLIDYSPEALGIAKQIARQLNVNADFVQCDIAELEGNVTPGKGCVTFNIGVVEHFKDMEPILSQMAAVSDEFALAIIPQKSFFWTTYIGILDFLGMMPDDFYIRLMGEKEFESEITKAGLEILWSRQVRILGIIPYLGTAFRSSDGRPKSVSSSPCNS